MLNAEEEENSAIFNAQLADSLYHIQALRKASGTLKCNSNAQFSTAPNLHGLSSLLAADGHSAGEQSVFIQEICSR